jgi:serine/threonine-protein kinase
LVSIYAYSKRELLKRFVAKNKIIISAAAAVMAAIIIGSGFAMHFAYAAHKARLRADRALVEVTAISGDAAALSRNSALKLDNYFHKLVAGMMKTTTDISSINFTQTAKVRSALDQLHASHPEIEAFFITTPNGKIIASSSSTIISQDEANLTVHPIKLKNYGEIYVSKAFRTANGENASVIQMPIRRQSTFKGMLSADMRMDKVVPTAIGFDPLKSEYQVWCMRPDGYILYDEDKNQVGRYLFTDEMFANFPELLALGQRMKEEPWGIGHYTFTARDQETIIYKIAAWDTFTPTPEINWKIVVTYPYISK